MIPHDQIVTNHRGKVPFEEKKSKCFFRAGTKKNKVIINMFTNDNNVDAQQSQNNYMTKNNHNTMRFTINYGFRYFTVFDMKDV